MQDSSSSSGGTQPERQPVTPPHPTAAKKNSLDGITTMSGTVSFTSTAVSVVINIDPVGGAEGSTFKAAGAQGNSVPAAATAPRKTATRNTNRNATPATDTISVSGLAAPALNGNYSIVVEYDSGGSVTRKATISGTRLGAFPCQIDNVSFA